MTSSAAPPSVPGFAEAIGWFRSQGVDRNQSITSGLWRSEDFDPAHGTRTAIVRVSGSDADGLTSVEVDEYGSARDAASDPTLVRDTVVHFVPEATDWVDQALLSTSPGGSTDETFGDATVEVSVSAVVVGSPVTTLLISREG
jgi:hypothetical protein